MLPFRKTPPAPQELELGTGDHVAYGRSYDGAYDRANAATPHRSRTAQPVFARSATPRAPYGFPQDFSPHASVQVAPQVHNDMRMMSHAPPPHSLTPVAMPRVAATSSHHAQDTVVLRVGRPDVRWGIGLALAGALLGGVFGVTMHKAKRDTARAAAAPVEPAPPPRAAAAPVQPAAPPVVAPQVAAAQPAASPVVIAPQPVGATQPPPSQAAAASTSVLPPPGPPAAPPTAYAGRRAPAAAHGAHSQSAHAAQPAAYGTHAAHAAHQVKVAAAPPPKPSPATAGGGQRLDLSTKVSTTPAPTEKADKSTFVDALRLKTDAQKDLSNTLGGSH